MSSSELKKSTRSSPVLFGEYVCNLSVFAFLFRFINYLMNEFRGILNNNDLNLLLYIIVGVDHSEWLYNTQLDTILVSYYIPEI